MAVKTYQNNFSSGMLGVGMWSRVDLQKYRSGAKRIVNGIVLPAGGVTKRPGTYLVEELPEAGRLIPFSYNNDQGYMLCFLDRKVRFYYNGGRLLDAVGMPYELDSPFALEHLPLLTYQQSMDMLFFAHPAYAPNRLIRNGHTDWVFEDMVFEPMLSPPGKPALALTGAGEATRNQTLEYKISAVTETEDESYPSEAEAVKVPRTWPSGMRVTVSWTAVSGAVKYKVYKNRRGYYGWIGTVEVGDELTFIDDNVEPAVDDGPKSDQNPFEDGNNPGAVGIFQQRLGYARSDLKRQTLWFSNSGNFNNFSGSYPMKDDDTIELTLDARQANEIRHILVLKESAVILTSGAEWTLASGRNKDAITPTSCPVRPQSYFGCSAVPPLYAGDSILIVQNSGTVVRDLYYAISEEYTGMELSILADTLFDAPISSWCFQNAPHHTAYAVKENGGLVTLTYLREHELYAWSVHETQGEYLAVGAVRHVADDQVYFITRRFGKVYLEFQKPRRFGEPVEDAFFVDCGLTYDGEPTRRITGLDHLAGRTVSALADGGVVPDQQVAADGSITLPHAASKVHVGLGFRTLIETLDPELGQNNSSAGERKRLVRVGVYLRETLGLQAGPDEDRLTDFGFAHPSTFNRQAGLFTGYKNEAVKGLHRPEATAVLAHPWPLPFTVQSVGLTITGENT